MRSCVLLTLFSCLLDLRRVEASGRPGRPDGGDGETERREFYDDVVITACFLNTKYSYVEGLVPAQRRRRGRGVDEPRGSRGEKVTHARGCEHRVLEE